MFHVCFYANISYFCSHLSLPSMSEGRYEDNSTLYFAIQNYFCFLWPSVHPPELWACLYEFCEERWICVRISLNLWVTTVSTVSSTLLLFLPSSNFFFIFFLIDLRFSLGVVLLLGCMCSSVLFVYYHIEGIFNDSISFSVNVQ